MPKLDPSKMTMQQVFEYYLCKRVRLEDGREGKVFGTDPRPKPDVNGTHYPEGNWLVIQLHPSHDTVYKLPQQVTIIA